MGFLLNQTCYMRRFFKYVKDTRGEMKHVSWPTRAQSIGFTVIVILLSLITAAYIGLFDWIFTTLIQTFLV